LFALLAPALPCLIRCAHGLQVDWRISLAQESRLIELVGHLGGDLTVFRAAADRLDSARSAEVGKRACLTHAEHQGPYVTEVVAERILGIGAARSIAKDRRPRRDFRSELSKIAVEDPHRTPAERTDRRAPRLRTGQFKGVSAASHGTSTEDMRGEFDKLVKALEVAGVTQDKPRLHSYINDVAKALNAFGDQIKPEDYFDMLRYGRQASSGISERFLMTTMATLGSEFGGSNIGTALGGFNQAVVGNRFTHTAALGFAQLGLIDEKDLARTKTGEIKGILPGRHVKDVQLAQSDPDLWIKQDYLPALAKAGITTPDQISARIAQDFTNRNAANLVTQIALQQAKLEKNTALWNQAGGLTGADLLGSKDASTAFAGVGNAIERWIAKRFDVDSYGQVGSAVSRAVGAVTPSPGPHPDLGGDAAADLKGWRDLFSSIRIGGPQTSEQWHADMRANSSLWGAAYRPGDLEQETARETARALSRSPQSFRGASDWEVKSQGLTLPSQAQQPAAPASVTVNGQAQVEHEITVRIEASPLLQAIVDQARQQSETTVPLMGGGTGRMDSDAAAHRVGGIGSM
jgi:hypothetical protein